MSLSNHLQGRASRVQAARDGAWESAWVWPCGGTTPSEPEIRRWIGESEGVSDIAFEVFFRDSEDSEPFLGVRLQGLDADRQARCLRRLAAEVQGRRWSTFAEVTSGLREVFPGLTDWASPPDALEVGVVDAWRSAGSCRVWRRGDPPLSPAALQARLAGCPALLRSQSRPFALELIYDGPLPCWLGIEVSVPEPGGYVLAPERVIEIARRVAR